MQTGSLGEKSMAYKTDEPNETLLPSIQMLLKIYSLLLLAINLRQLLNRPCSCLKQKHRVKYQKGTE